MAVVVVEQLEVVEVEQHEGEWARSLRHMQLVRDPLLETTPAERSGEGIGAGDRVKREPLLGVDPGRDHAHCGSHREQRSDQEDIGGAGVARQDAKHHVSGHGDGTDHHHRPERVEQAREDQRQDETERHRATRAAVEPCELEQHLSRLATSLCSGAPDIVYLHRPAGREA